MLALSIEHVLIIFRYDKAAVSKVMYNDSLLFNDKVSKSFWYITSHSCCVKKF